MGYPKHKYGWIVIGPNGHPLSDNGIGIWTEASFGEVILDRKAALWLRDKERKWHREMAQHYRAGIIENGVSVVRLSDLNHAAYHDRAVVEIRLEKIALPGTYAQFKVPGRLERRFQKGMVSKSRAQREFLKLTEGM